MVRLRLAAGARRVWPRRPDTGRGAFVSRLSASCEKLDVPKGHGFPGFESADGSRDAYIEREAHRRTPNPNRGALRQLVSARGKLRDPASAVGLALYPSCLHNRFPIEASH